MTTTQAPLRESTTGPHQNQDDYRETHPAYAQISANRVQGGLYLYGSEFQHRAYVTLRIQKSEVERSLSRDWPHARAELLEVALSEAQWAQLVSSLNQGSGVPCTLQSVAGERVAQLPAPEPRTEQYRRELAGTLADARGHLERLQTSLNDLKLTRAQRSVIDGAVHQALMNLGANVEFVGSSFDRHMETSVTRAQSEINAYLTTELTRMGLQALQHGEAPAKPTAVIALNASEDASST